MRATAVDYCERKRSGNINYSDLPRAYVGLIDISGTDDIFRTHAAPMRPCSIKARSCPRWSSLRRRRSGRSAAFA